MSKGYHVRTMAVAARPRSAKLREAGYYTAITVGKNAGSNAGQTPVDGASNNLFEEILDGNGNVIGAKALHDLHIIQTPANEEAHQEEVTKDITGILKHLSLQVLNEGQVDEETIMFCDITFVNEKNIISGGIGPGGNPAGDGSIATLVDVTLANLAGGDILKYNATSSHWENTPLALSALADVSLGNPDNGQALVYSSTLGKWVPGTIDTGVTVDSEDATIGTGLTTLATIDGISIKAKIASYLLASNFTGSNIASTLGNNVVNRAEADESGNNIKSTYAVGLYEYNGRLYLKSKSNELLSGYADGSDLVAVIGNNAVARASADASGNTIASQTWVGDQGFLTSSDLSGYATQSWVEGQDYLTSADLSGYATQSWVWRQNFVSENEVAAYLDDNGYATQTWVGQQGYLTSSALSGYATQSWVGNNYLGLLDFTAANIVSTLGRTPVNRADADANGNTFTTSYLRKDIDDTMGGNLTIGTASSKKTLTIRGTTGEALTIYGNSNYTELYRNSDGLNISTDCKVYGNIVVTGQLSMSGASDRRLKKDIRTINLKEAADLLSALNPVAYRWNDDAAKLGGLRGVGRGFLADEYLALLPNAGRKIWDNYDAIDYYQAIPYLVAGWQQQNLRMRILEGEIKALKEDNEGLRRRLKSHGIQ